MSARMHEMGPLALSSGTGAAESGSMELTPLSTEECAHLLALGGVGRVGVSVGALPVVLPVNYAMLDGDVVIRTGAGTKLDAALCGSVVAFEIDDVDTIYHEGWSVVVQGRASEITEQLDVARARQLPLRPWAPGLRDHFVRIKTERLSGRRLSVQTHERERVR